MTTSTPFRYDLIEPQDAAKHGIPDPDFRRMVQYLGRSPNTLEAGVLSYIWSDDVSGRSGHMFLRSVFRKVPEVLGSRGASFSVVDIGFQEQLILCSKSGTRLGSMDPREGARGTFLSCYEEFSILAGQKPQAASVILHIGEGDQSRSQHFIQLALEGLTRAANSCAVPIVEQEFYTLTGHELFPAFAIHLSGVRRAPTQPPALRSPGLTGAEVLLYLGKETVVISRKRGDHGLPIASAAHSDYFSETVNSLVQSDALVAVQPVTRGGLAVAFAQLANTIGAGLLCSYENIPFHREGVLPEIGLTVGSPHRCLAIARPEAMRQITETFSRGGFRADQIGKLARERSISIDAQHRTIFSVPLPLMMVDEEEKSYDLLRYPPMLYRSEAQGSNTSEKKTSKNRSPWEDVWLDFLADTNACSRQRLSKDVDKFATGEIFVDGNYAGGLIRIPSLPSFLGNRPYRGLASALRSYPVIASSDPYLGGAHAAADALRTIAACGAQPVAAAQSLFFGTPTQYRRLSEFSESVRGLTDACQAWNIPIVNDTVDFQAEHQVPATPPTAAIFMVGIHPDIRNRVGTSFCDRGDRLLLIGRHNDSLAGSEYARYMLNSHGGSPPEVNYQSEVTFATALTELAAQKLVKSSTSVGVGGLAIALVSAALKRSSHLGASLTVPGLAFESLLFAEGPTRALITCAPEREETIRSVCAAFDVPVMGTGEVGGRELTIRSDHEMVSISASTAAQIWHRSLDFMLNAVA